jgi:uncharacterized coiled-coil protein SlyX
MTMPSENREESNQGEGGKDGRQGSVTHSEANEAIAADQAAYVPPSRPRRWGGRAILGMQKLFDKVLAGRVVQLQGQVIDQDRELSELAHDVAELTTQVVQANRMLHSIDERLARLEAMNKSSDPE